MSGVKQSEIFATLRKKTRSAKMSGVQRSELFATLRKKTGYNGFGGRCLKPPIDEDVRRFCNRFS